MNEALFRLRPKTSEQWEAKIGLLRDIGFTPSRLSGVYFIGCHGLIKIGASNNVVQRASEIAQSAPFDVERLGWLPEPNIEAAFILERALHQRFASCRHKGEWFTPNAALLALIDEKCWPFPQFNRNGNIEIRVRQ